jgi:hypothetical protein
MFMLYLKPAYYTIGLIIEEKRGSRYFYLSISFMCLKTLTRVVAHFLSSKRMYTAWFVVTPPPEPLECML